MLGSPGVSNRSCVNYGCRSEVVIRGSPRDSSCQEQEAWASDLATSIMNWVPGRVPLPVHISLASVGKAGQNQHPLCRARETAM